MSDSVAKKLKERVGVWLESAISSWTRVRERAHRLGLLIAAGFFIAGVVIAVGTIDVELTPESYWLFAAVAFIGVPLSVLVNAAEVVATGRLVRVAVPWEESIRVAVLGTAANMLPIPGAAVVRVDALVARGAPVRSAARGILATGAIWLAVSGILASALLSAGDTWIALTIFALGMFAAIAAWWVLPRSDDAQDRRAGVVSVILVELATIAVTTFRLVLILLAIGISPSLTDVVILSSAYAVSAAVGIVPGGLGVREALTAGVAAALGIGANTGFLASAIDRLIGLIVQVPIVLLLYIRDRRHQVTKQLPDSWAP